MGIFKRVVKDILRAGLPDLREHPAIIMIDDVRDGNENVKFIRDAATAETVNELAARRAGQVEDAMFVGRVYKAYRKHHSKRRK